ncbi:hypothetical protein [Grimontia sp. NTOU-MAR1]|uniref:hypothetical protein n=1 Tax=Grimontia sp. NTOU-MAR1 TaxID=3111011 RepID=UPI002DB9014D|nr:hypothetical protein [Grimontia sp. NTOU-MAR1]WRV96241.1 hypothetical protein VP504_00040 [Grimontia sp. NTOU-MAR1]
MSSMSCDGGAVHLIAILIGDREGVTHRGAVAHDGVVDVAIELIIIDVAVVIGIFSDGQDNSEAPPAP